MMLAGNIPKDADHVHSHLYGYAGRRQRKGIHMGRHSQGHILAVILLMNLWNDRQSRRNKKKR